MSCARGPNYRHLNRGGDWPDFSYQGLDQDAAGVLRLRSLPLAGSGVTEAVEGCEPGANGGLAIGCDGTVFWSDPECGVVHRIPACKPRPQAAAEDRACREPERGRPSAVELLERRGALVVADAANHRLDLYSLATFQWLGAWGEPGSADGQLDTPVALASDRDGYVYVAEAGAARLQKFDGNGGVVPSFRQRAQGSTPALDRPVAMDVADVGDGETLWVLDAAGVVHSFALDGSPLGSVELEVAEPSGLLVANGAFYVGDNGNLRLLRFGLDGEFVGSALGYRGPVAALAGGPRGDIWLLPGCGLTPLALEADGAFVRRGVLWGGPFGDGERARLWQHLRPVGEAFDAPGVHVRWFVFASDSAVPPPDPDPSAAEPFDPSSWRALAPDSPDVWIGLESIHLWLGAVIEGDGTASPELSNLRVDFDRAGYARHLPAIYQTRTDDLDGLQRFLGLFESFFVDAESAIDGLERLFDPEATPAEWLDWLAGWVGLAIDQNWSEEKKREAIAEAWDRHRRRGTARGLREALHLYAGVDAQVEEPLLQSSWWALSPEDDTESAAAEASVLGFTTMLAASEPAGAILGSSAVLDQSQLITQEDYGAPLFEATAHQFSVRLFSRQISGADQLGEIREVIERDKPAHTLYHLCVVEPRLRIGYQARLGVDAVIGGGPGEPSSLGIDAPENGGLALGGPPAGRLGRDSQLGIQTWLGAAPVEAGTECQLSERRTHGHQG